MQGRTYNVAMPKKDNQLRSAISMAAILVLLYIAFTGVPAPNLYKDEQSKLLFMAMVRLFYLPLFFFFARKETFYQGRRKIGFSLLSLPLFLVCFSNLFVLVFDRSAISPNSTSSNLWAYFLFALSVSIAEELIFRDYVLRLALKKMKPLYAILLSSVIFALPHLLNILAGAGVGESLAQVGYTFGIGLILGLLYLYGGGLLPCFLFHFLFNFINSGLFETIAIPSWNKTFILVNVIIGIIAALYGVFFYFLKQRKQKESAAQE